MTDPNPQECLNQQPQRMEQEYKLAIFVRSASVLAGAVLPVFSFWLGMWFLPDWQSGEYCQMLLTPYATWPFWPVILYSMICLCVLHCNKRPLIHRAIRIGLYLGVIWSFQYVMILPFGLKQFIDWGSPAKIFLYGFSATVVPIFIAKCLMNLSKKIRRSVLFVFFGSLPIVLTACIYVNNNINHEFIGAMFLLLFVCSLVASPFWCFAVYLYSSIYVFRQARRENKLMSIKNIFAFGIPGAIAYAGAWWVSIHSMLNKYYQLPTEPPDCFIATAAAQGHRGFVKSSEAELSNGRVINVNDQLKRLKGGELVLKASLPKLHRTIRLIYNAVGPVLAKCLKNPFAADIVYVLLKPFEWFACVLIIFNFYFMRKRV